MESIMQKKAHYFIAIYYFIGFFFLIFAHTFFPVISPDYYIIFFVATFTLLIVIASFRGKTDIAIILGFAILLRFAIMMWNVYGRNIYNLPGIGTDTELFFESGKRIAEDLSLLKEHVYGTYYSKYLGILFNLCGISYLLASFINFLCGVLSIAYMNKALSQFKCLDLSIKKMVLVLFSFAPSNMIICSSMRRESFIIFFITISLYFIVSWYNSGRTKYWILAIASVLGASVLHAGVIGILFGYIVLILFYQVNKGSWEFTLKTIVIGLLLIGLALLIVFQYRNVFLAKLSFDDEETIYRMAQRSPGGAAYLSGIRINSVTDLIKYIPIKVIYFIFSPMPQNWRGINDFIAFALDALIYFFFFIYLLIGTFKRKKEPLLFGLCISAWIPIITYGLACGNSATAMRHRLKLLSLLIFVFLLIKQEKSDFAKLKSRG